METHRNELFCSYFGTYCQMGARHDSGCDHKWLKSYFPNFKNAEKDACMNITFLAKSDRQTTNFIPSNESAR